MKEMGPVSIQGRIGQSPWGKKSKLLVPKILVADSEKRGTRSVLKKGVGRRSGKGESLNLGGRGRNKDDPSLGTATRRRSDNQEPIKQKSSQPRRGHKKSGWLSEA